MCWETSRCKGYESVVAEAVYVFFWNGHVETVACVIMSLQAGLYVLMTALLKKLTQDTRYLVKSTFQGVCQKSTLQFEVSQYHIVAWHMNTDRGCHFLFRISQLQQ